MSTILLVVLAGLAVSIGLVVLHAYTMEKSSPLAAAIMFAGALVPLASLFGEASILATLLTGMATWAFGVFRYFPDPAY